MSGGWAVFLACALQLAVPAATPAPESTASFLDGADVVKDNRASARSGVQAMAMACVMLCMAGGGCAWFVHRKNAAAPAAQGDNINLLALKPLGGRQRLALVEVCGERLLLAANEREVTLLSHLPQVSEGADEAAFSLDNAPAPAAVELQPTLKGHTVADLEEALSGRGTPSAAAGQADAYGSDLAGLHRWQERAQVEGRA